MASLTGVDAPGAFPETPMFEEDPMQRTVRNQSFRREEPRGLSVGAERDTPRSGNGLTDSGIFVDEPSAAQGSGPAVSSREVPYQPAQFSNETTPRSLGSDAFPSQPRGGDAVVNIDNNAVFGDQFSDAGLASRAPGPYSRIGHHDNLTSDHSNYRYDVVSDSQPMDGMGAQKRDDGVPIGTALGFPAPLNTSKPSAYTSKPVDDFKPEKTLQPESNFKPASALKLSSAFTPANTPATSTPLAGSNADPMAESRAERGMAGLTDSEHPQKDWNEVPFGTGTYNGVTGHGSNEAPAHQSSPLGRYSPNADAGVHNGVTGHGSNKSHARRTSLLEQYGPETGAGIHNGVIGHGSDESTSLGSRMFPGHQEHDTTTGGSSTKQRAFPLVSHSKTKSTDMSNDANERERDPSHSKGMLAAGAGTAAMGGYAAHHELSSHKDDHHRAERATEVPRKGEEKTLPLRPAAAAKKENLTEDHYRDYSRNTEDHHKSEHDSHHAGRLGAAGAAGAYGAHKLAHHNGEEEHRSVQLEDTSATREQPQYNTLSDGTSSGIMAGSDNQMVGAHDSKQQPWYNKLADGTHSGTMANDAHVTTDREQSPRYNKLSDGMPSGVAVDSAAQYQQFQKPLKQSTERSSISSDSSNGGMYNVLSSGTPSGINLENVHHHH